jgi:hypothetical protein
MKHADFTIGETFVTGSGRWRCTDLGTRVVVAIKLDAADETWYNGPPYALVESVFDEYDQAGCHRDEHHQDRAVQNAGAPAT